MTSDVGRTALRPIGPRRSPTTAWWGILMLVASEATLFGAAIASYFYLRLRVPQWPPPPIPEPAVAVPVALALTLAVTSIPMQLSALAAAAGRGRAALAFLGAAFVVQAGYLAYQVHSYLADLDRFRPQANAYGSIYFFLLGADHAHVFLGLLLSLWLASKLVRGLTRYRQRAASAIALYWQAVNLLTLVVTATILSARL